MANPLTKTDNLLVTSMGLAISLGIVFVAVYTISVAWQKGKDEKKLAKS